MINLIVFFIMITLLSGIAVILKKGFNEVIKGLESLDDRLKKMEERLKDN